MQKKQFALAVFGFALCQTALAGIVGVPPTTTTTFVPGTSSDTQTKAYAGLRWDLGGTLMPALVLGVRQTKVKRDGNTSGADISLALLFTGGVGIEKLRLKGFSGKEGFQGELGGGYSFSGKSFFVGGGGNGPYFNLGVDWLPGVGLTPSVMLHTEGKYDKPTGGTNVTTQTCPPGTVLNPGTGLCA